MNYATIRDKLVADLQSIPGIGKVYNRPRAVKDWASFFALNAVTNPHDPTKNVISIAWVTRKKSLGTDTNDETSSQVIANRNDTWEITLIYGFSDDDTFPSEGDFQGLIDLIINKWELMSSLGLPDTVNNSSAPQLQDASLMMYSEVLCHRALFSIGISQIVNS